MEKKNNSSLTVAGILLVLASLPFFCVVIKNIYSFDLEALFNGLFVGIGFLVSAIGLLTDRKAISIVGVFFVIVYCVYSMLAYFGSGTAFRFLGFLFLLLAVIFNNHASIWLGILAAVLLFFVPYISGFLDVGTRGVTLAFQRLYRNPFHSLEELFSGHIQCNLFSVLSIISRFIWIGLYFLTPIASVLIGIGMSKKTTNSTKVPVAKFSTAGTTIAQLTQLKGLLDKGIITQEEFNEKKKEILKND